MYHTFAISSVFGGSVFVCGAKRHSQFFFKHQCATLERGACPLAHIVHTFAMLDCAKRRSEPERA